MCGGWEGSQAPRSQAKPPPLPAGSPPLCPLRLHSPMPKGIFSSLCQSIMKVHSTSKGISGGRPEAGPWGQGPNRGLPGWCCWVQGVPERPWAVSG